MNYDDRKLFSFLKQVFFVFIFLSPFAFCSLSYFLTPAESTLLPNKEYPNKKAGSFCAYSKDDLKLMNEILENKDPDALLKMISQNKAVMLSSKDSLVYMEGYDPVKVRIKGNTDYCYTPRSNIISQQ